MKRLIPLLFILCSTTVFAQEKRNASAQGSTSTDSGVEKTIKVNGEVFTKSIGRYKIYPTSNMFNFLKLDTQTGCIFKIQWNTGEDKRFESPVSSDALDYGEKTNGRFEMYPTDNIYTFLLLDKIDGRTWQVQWSLQAKENHLLRIY